MKTVIVSTSPAFGSIGKVPDAITGHGWKLIRCIDTDQPYGGAEPYLADMDILVVGLIGATAELISKAPKLKAILKHGVGVDNIDIPAATKRGIPVINAPGSNANAVAELAIGCMFSLARQIPMVHQVVIGGGWKRHVGSEIEGKILGIVGLGNIGKILAAKARSLGMKVVATDLYQDQEFATTHQVDYVPLDELLGQADYVSLHLFGGKDNYHLINAERLALMKPSAYLMNFARGDIVDLDALASALATEKLHGAAIDAYVEEPPDYNHPIFKHPRVIFTPHSGADTTESVERVGLMNIGDIELILKRERSPRMLNPDVYNN